jgi:hypothetical protein
MPSSLQNNLFPHHQHRTTRYNNIRAENTGSLCAERTKRESPVRKMAQETLEGTKRECCFIFVVPLRRSETQIFIMQPSPNNRSAENTRPRRARERWKAAVGTVANAALPQQKSATDVARGKRKSKGASIADQEAERARVAAG